MAEEKDKCRINAKIVTAFGGTEFAARNLITSVPQSAATTFAFPSLFILLLGVSVSNLASFVLNWAIIRYSGVNVCLYTLY